LRAVPIVAITGNVVRHRGKGLQRHAGKTETSLRIVPLPRFVVESEGRPDWAREDQHSDRHLRGQRRTSSKGCRGHGGSLAGLLNPLIGGRVMSSAVCAGRRPDTRDGKSRRSERRSAARPPDTARG
jgi:hypothetical protein